VTLDKSANRRTLIAALVAFVLLAVPASRLLQRSPNPNLLLGMSSEFWAGVCLGLSLMSAIIAVKRLLPMLIRRSR
jgi:hypothetical protein